MAKSKATFMRGQRTPLSTAGTVAARTPHPWCGKCPARGEEQTQSARVTRDAEERMEGSVTSREMVPRVRGACSANPSFPVSQPQRLQIHSREKTTLQVTGVTQLHHPRPLVVNKYVPFSSSSAIAQPEAYASFSRAEMSDEIPVPSNEAVTLHLHIGAPINTLPAREHDGKQVTEGFDKSAAKINTSFQRKPRAGPPFKRIVGRDFTALKSLPAISPCQKGCSCLQLQVRVL